MSNEFVSNNPETFISRGFMTGRTLTLGGVRAGIKKAGESGRVGMQFFFTEVAKDGERRILSSFLHDGAWGDQMKPSDNLKGLVPEAGADKPFVEKDSPLGLFNTALKQAGCPAKLQTGDYSKLIGMELVLEEKALPSFKRKKSVDPDEKAAPAKEYKTEVPSKIITLPADNADYVKLTEKEITKHLKEVEDKRSARKAAQGNDPELDAAVDEVVDAATADDDDEEPKPAKKGKKAKSAPVEDDDDEPASDSFGDDDDEPAAADDDEPETPEEDSTENPAEALAAKLILKVLKADKKVKGSALLQKVHPHLAGTDKKITAAVLKLVQSPKFIAGVDGVTVKGNMVVLG